MTRCIHEILMGGVNYITSNLQSEKIAFSKGGVAWPYAPMMVWLGGGQLHQVKSAVKKKLALVEV